MISTSSTHFQTEYIRNARSVSDELVFSFPVFPILHHRPLYFSLSIIRLNPVVVIVRQRCIGKYVGDRMGRERRWHGRSPNQ